MPDQSLFDCRRLLSPPIIGIGALLFQAIKESDFFLIQGIVFTVIVALGFATFLLDVLYPLLDPRISYRHA